MLEPKVVQECKKCVNCPLHTHRKNVVFGRGSMYPKVMIVGEAPGFNEDLRGEAFIGSSGILLSNMLRSVGWDDDDVLGNVYITNAVKCRPPENRTPTIKERNACLHWLQYEIETLKPKVLLLLGNTPLKSLGFNNVKVSELVGKNKVLDYQGIPVVGCYHPAFLLRNPEMGIGTPKYLSLLSLLKVQRILKSCY